MKYYIGHQLRKLRTDQGYSQEYVAKKLKISQSSYSEIENNQETVTLGKLNQIAEILDKNPIELIQLNGQPVINLYNNQTANGIVINDSSVVSKDLIEKLTIALNKVIDLGNQKNI